jgi:hypothetical protein
MSSVRQEYLNWALDRKEHGEHVSLPEFVLHFNLSNKEDSAEAF